MLYPFWRYYGAKWRLAPRYPSPDYPDIVEPFAGAAGYSLRYPERRVSLVEINPVVCGVWRYLIAVSPSEIRRIPNVEDIDDLPGWVPEEARNLVGFNLNSAIAAPRRRLSSGWKILRSRGRTLVGWSAPVKERIASQVEAIRHWSILEASYAAAPPLRATWFIDPPYQAAGHHYPFHRLDYEALGNWCLGRLGQLIVCEASGASWLPFSHLCLAKAGPRSAGSREAVFIR